MSKNIFGLPMILMSSGLDDGGEGDEPVGGSAHGHFGGEGGNKVPPFACSFETWSEKFASDCYKDGIVDFNDYGQWWADSGLGEDAWNQFNTGLPFNWKSQNER